MNTVKALAAAAITACIPAAGPLLLHPPLPAVCTHTAPPHAGEGWDYMPTPEGGVWVGAGGAVAGYARYEDASFLYLTEAEAATCPAYENEKSHH